MTKPFRIHAILTALLLSGHINSGQAQSLDRIPVRPRLEPSGEELPMPSRLPQNDTVNICIIGDIMMHTAQIRNALIPGSDPAEHSSYSFNCFRLIEDRLENADLTIGNMEFTMAGAPFTGYPCFSAPDTYAAYAAECGIDVFLTANNHILDKGSAGTARTLAVYEGLGKKYSTRYTGCSPEGTAPSQALVIKTGNTRIGLLNFTYGTNTGKTSPWPDVNYLNEKTVEACFCNARAKEAEVFIILPHWGEEYQLRNSPAQKKAAEMLISKGADVIIGAHPHVVQNMEKMTDGKKEVQVVYSMGNAVSNMSAKNTRTGLMVHMELVRKMNGKVEVLPLRYTWLWCSRPGGYDTGYTVIPIEEFIGRREEWIGKYDYDRMISTWRNVQEITGIK